MQRQYNQDQPQGQSQPQQQAQVAGQEGEGGVDQGKQMEMAKTGGNIDQLGPHGPQQHMGPGPKLDQQDISTKDGSASNLKPSEAYPAYQVPQQKQVPQPQQQQPGKFH